MRIPFDSITLAALLHETDFLRGAKVQRIIQPTETEIVFGLYTKGTEHSLIISWHPELFRIHTLSQRPSAPTEPPTLCMTLRKYLAGGRLEFIRQRGLDRIVDFGFTSAHGDFQLVVELMGRHSNLILVDSNRRILATAKTVSAKQSKRPIRTGQTYEPPPFEPKPSILRANPSDNLKEFEGYSPFLARLLEEPSLLPLKVSAGPGLDPGGRGGETITNHLESDNPRSLPPLMGRGRGGETESHEATELNSLTLELLQTILTKNAWQPHFSHESGAYPLDFTLLDPTAIPRPTLSIALEQAYALRESRDALASQRQSLLNQLQRVADARRAALRGITEAIATANRAPEIQAQAELILAYQGSIRPGQETLEAYDYQGNPITIPLDPEKTAVENANRLFNRAKHAKERRDEVSNQGDRLQQDLTTVESLIHLVQSATTREALDQHRAEAKSRNYLHLTGAPKAKEDRPFEGHLIRELLSPAGYRVLYGTNSTSNDYLTNRVAKGNDIWLHVRGQTSAHVIIQTQGNPDKVQKPDLLFAALVAVKNSPAKHGSYVPVDYTLKKYVRKPRGSAPGLAVYEREKTLHVDP
ncbi:hypothetical protein C0431_08750 [bacterium]|nr:hypothetical protein [bacterium]